MQQNNKPPGGSTSKSQSSLPVCNAHPKSLLGTYPKISPSQGHGNTKSTWVLIKGSRNIGDGRLTDVTVWGWGFVLDQLMLTGNPHTNLWVGLAQLHGQTQRQCLHTVNLPLGYSERIRKDVGADTVQTHHARAKQTNPLADTRLLLQIHTGSAASAQAGGSAAVL